MSKFSLVRFITKRENGERFPSGLGSEILKFAETAAAHAIFETTCKLKGSTKSTFILAFDTDGRRLVSLHGDHTLRVVELGTGRSVRTLTGHPRSPWTAEFHKCQSDILASGCLAGQVRIWDLSTGRADVWTSAAGHSVSSLALHPTDKLLLIAVGHRIYVWNWEHASEPQLYTSTQRPCERVRWIKFDFYGDFFYTGITSRAELDSWMVLRQAPSAQELAHYRTVRRLPFPNDPSFPPVEDSDNTLYTDNTDMPNNTDTSSAVDNREQFNVPTSIDVYEAATALAQLHQVHDHSHHDVLHFENIASSSTNDSYSTQPMLRSNHPESGSNREPGVVSRDDETAVYATAGAAASTRSISIQTDVSAPRGSTLLVTTPGNSNTSPLQASLPVAQPLGNRSLVDDGANYSDPSSSRNSSLQLQSDNIYNTSWRQSERIILRLEGNRAAHRHSSTVGDLISRLENLLHSNLLLDADNRSVRHLLVTVMLAYRRTQNLLSTNLRSRILSVLSRMEDIVVSPLPPVPRATEDAADGSSPAEPEGRRPRTATRIGVSWARPLMGSNSRSLNDPMQQVGMRMRDRIIGLLSGLGLTGVAEQNFQTSTLINRTQRIQRWPLAASLDDMGDDTNIVVTKCRIHNDASIDISADGELLVCIAMIYSIGGITEQSNVLQIVSLREESLGCVLQQFSIGATAVSLSLSPRAGFLLVGQVAPMWNPGHSKYIFNIYDISRDSPKVKAARVELLPSVGPNELGLVNCVKWFPNAGQGFAVGTNQGSVRLMRASS